MDEVAAGAFIGMGRLAMVAMEIDMRASTFGLVVALAPLLALPAAPLKAQAQAQAQAPATPAQTEPRDDALSPSTLPKARENVKELGSNHIDALSPDEARRLDRIRAKSAKQDAARREAAKQEAAKREAAKQEAARREATRQEALKQEAARQEAARQETARREAAKLEAARQEAAKQAAAKQEAARLEAARQEAAKREAARQEAARLEAARQEAAKQAAAKQEAARLEAAKLEAAKQEAAKREAAKQEAARQEAAKREAARQEAAKREAAKQEAARQEAAKREAARQEAAAHEAIKHDVAKPTTAPTAKSASSTHETSAPVSVATLPDPASGSKATPSHTRARAGETAAPRARRLATRRMHRPSDETADFYDRPPRRGPYAPWRRGWPEVADRAPRVGDVVPYGAPLYRVPYGPRGYVPYPGEYDDGYPPPRGYYGRPW